MNGILKTLGIGAGSEPEPEATAAVGGGAAPAALPAAVVLLVIDADDEYDWAAIFAGRQLRDGRPIEVVQAVRPNNL